MTTYAGQEVEADDLNPPAGGLNLSADQSVPDTTSTKILVDTQDFDYRSVIDAGNNQLVVPSGSGGLWRITFGLRWASSATGDRVAWVEIDGVTQLQQSAKGVGTTRGGTTHSMSRELDLSAGAVIACWGFQSSGGSLDALTNFGGTYLSASLVRAT